MRRHSFYDLDDTWLEYLKADREERKKMCEDGLNIMAIVYSIVMFFIIGLAIYALCTGVI